MKIVIDGQPYNHAPTKELAIRMKLGRWQSNEPCKICHNPVPLRYVADNSCSNCLQLKAWKLRNVPTNKYEALAVGQYFYYAKQYRVCKHGPHIMRCSVTTGRCIDCKTILNTARQHALDKSLRTYRPSRLCLECGKQATRLTSTDECLGCHPELRVHRTRSVQPVRVSRLTISDQTWNGKRWDALAGGFKYYQDGSSCRHGHMATIRYVKSGGCLKCLGITIDSSVNKA